MKKTILLIALCLLLTNAAFSQEQAKDTTHGYEIAGQIAGAYKGNVYLIRENGLHGPQTVIDSAPVTNGQFLFKGNNVPEYSVIHFIRSQDGQLAPVFLESGQIRIQMRADHFLGANVQGTVNNNLWTLHQLSVNHWKDSIRLAAVTDWMRFGQGTPEEQDRNFRYRTQLQNSNKLNMEKYMVRHYNDQAFAPFILLFEMTEELSLDELKELRGQLNEKLNNHPYTQALDEVILHKGFKIGSTAPAFSIQGIDGKEIELKNYAGKYVLLDFWASWCGPCRREMPHVVKLYKTCKGKNFEIIGISLDQKESEWKKAIKELGMTWPQACDFQVWQSPVARKYNLHAVPYTVLINPEGKVEAIDLRGEELTNTIKSLLKK